MNLLLDETICAGTVAVPREMVRLAGGVNKRLGAKQKYELLLRIAAETPVELEETDEDACGQENMLVFDDAEEPENSGCGWRTDCYVLGKYSAQLQEAGYFNAAIEAVLAEAQMEGRYEETVSYLEGMIGHKEEYYRIDEAAQPILIYKGDPVCYNILTIFAEQLGAALERRGERVLYFDQEEHDPREIIQFKGKHFKAVIGVQSCAFSIKMEDEVHYLHEYIYGPKYNFFLDHPIWGKPHFEHHYPDFHVLVLDQTYADFFRRFYKQEAILFPPAGMEAVEDSVERIYDLTFVGTYGGYEVQLQWIREQERPLRFLANRFLLTMRKYPNLTAEAAFSRTLEHYGMELTDEEFVEKMYAVRPGNLRRDALLQAPCDRDDLTVRNPAGCVWRQLDALPAPEISQSDLPPGGHCGGGTSCVETVQNVPKCDVLAQGRLYGTDGGNYDGGSRAGYG